MTSKAKRRRLTIASLMTSILVLSLLLMVVLPVLRQGPPSCMTPVSTARWLLARPGQASCADCHGSTEAPDDMRALAALVKPPQECVSPAGRGTKTNSCIACHTP